MRRIRSKQPFVERVDRKLQTMDRRELIMDHSKDRLIEQLKEQLNNCCKQLRTERKSAN